MKLGSMVFHPLHWIFSREKRKKEFQKGKIMATYA
jgi:hypothetical protein